MADTRLTTSAVPDPNTPGHFLITCDDGSQFTSRSFGDSPEGVRVFGSAPDGEVAADGPLLTEPVRAELVALGCDHILVHSAPPKSYTDAAAAPAAPVSDAPVALSSGETQGGVVLSQEEHEQTKGILARIESFLGDAEKHLVAEMRALLHHV